MAIMQRDEYYIPIIIKRNGEVVDNTVDRMIIKIGDIAKTDLAYEDNKWLYPITQEESQRLVGYTPVQAQFKIGDDIFNTPVRKVEIGYSIINKHDEGEENEL